MKLKVNVRRRRSKIIRTIEAVVDKRGRIRLLEDVKLPKARRALVTLFDWIVDLGPEGGEAGGRIVAEGTPEAVARSKRSFTGQALAAVLNGRTGS